MEQELRIRGYSPRTVSAYTRCLRDYFLWCKGNYGVYNNQLLKDFLATLHDRDLAASTINPHLNAINFFYKQVLHLPVNNQIRASKRSRKLPVVLSHKEIICLLFVTANAKHRLLLALAYSAGCALYSITFGTQQYSHRRTIYMGWRPCAETDQKPSVSYYSVKKAPTKSIV